MKYTPVTSSAITPRNGRIERLGRAIDRLVGIVSPQALCKRKAKRMMSDLIDVRARQLGVSWTRSDRTRDGRWMTSGLSNEETLKYDIEELQERCAEMYRTNSVAHAAVEARVQNEIGTGIKPQSMIEDDEAANDALEELFTEWSRAGVDLSRSYSFFEFERLANRSLGIYGEVFVLLSVTPSTSDIGLTLEIIAPERIVTPPNEVGNDSVRMGVEYRENGTIRGYHVAGKKLGEYEFYPRYDERGRPRMIHAFDRLYPGQSRGVPWLASSIDRMKDLDDWFGAELTAKNIESYFALLISGGENSEAPIDIAIGNATETTGSGKKIEKIEPGMIEYLDEGAEVKTVDPQRPGGTFSPFVEKANRSIAATIGLPYEILSKDFFRTTFSSGQLAMLDGRHGFKLRRQTLIEGVFSPIWGVFVDEAVFSSEANGTIPINEYVSDRRRYERATWISPGWGFINPRDEVRAMSGALEANITNLTTIYSERGEDFSLQMEKRRDELMRLTEIEVEVEAYREELRDAAGLQPDATDAASATGAASPLPGSEPQPAAKE